MCLRAKRGLTDTAAPGGFYKDKVYFEGAVEILKQRQHIDWELLFSGKLALEDLSKPEVVAQAVTAGLKFPPFLRNLPQYLRVLDHIATTNFLA